MSGLPWWLCGGLALGLAACTVDEDGKLVADLGDPQDWIDPVEYHLAAMSTAAWMGTIAAGWFVDAGHPCATLEEDLSLTLVPGPECPHPLLEGLGGSARVTFSSEDGSLISASAADLEVDGRPLLATEFPLIAVVPSPELISVVLATSDYGDAQTQWGWVIRIQTEGTPESTDDTLFFEGGTFSAETLPQDYREGDNSVSLSANLVLTPECRRNPVWGWMIIEGSSYWPLLQVNGQTTCDGSMHIDSTQQPSEWTPTLDLLAER